MSRFLIVAFELSFTAIPISALFTLILSRIKNDFSPTDKALSPQLDNLISGYLISNLEKIDE